MALGDDTNRLTGLNIPTRPYSVDTIAQQRTLFPLEAWEFDDPNRILEPLLTLKEPWNMYFKDGVYLLYSPENDGSPNDRKEGDYYIKVDTNGIQFVQVIAEDDEKILMQIAGEDFYGDVQRVIIASGMRAPENKRGQKRDSWLLSGRTGTHNCVEVKGLTTVEDGLGDEDFTASATVVNSFVAGYNTMEIVATAGADATLTGGPTEYLANQYYSMYLYTAYQATEVLLYKLGDANYGVEVWLSNSSYNIKTIENGVTKDFASLYPEIDFSLTPSVNQLSFLPQYQWQVGNIEFTWYFNGVEQGTHLISDADWDRSTEYTATVYLQDSSSGANVWWGEYIIEPYYDLPYLLGAVKRKRVFSYEFTERDLFFSADNRIILDGDVEITGSLLNADSDYEHFIVTGEENGALSTTTNSGYQWSYGDGGNKAGVGIMVDCELFAITYSNNTVNTTEAQIAVWYDGASIGTITVPASSATATYTLPTPAAVTADSFITFRTLAGSGGTGHVVSAHFQRAFDGLQGPQGEQGADGPQGEQGEQGEIGYTFADGGTFSTEYLQEQVIDGGDF